jgi:hypothetical protein
VLQDVLDSLVHGSRNVAHAVKQFFARLDEPMVAGDRPVRLVASFLEV